MDHWKQGWRISLEADGNRLAMQALQHTECRRTLVDRFLMHAGAAASADRNQQEWIHSGAAEYLSVPWINHYKSRWAVARVRLNSDANTSSRKFWRSLPSE